MNKNLVEAIALAVVAAFRFGGFFGLEPALGRSWARRAPTASAATRPSASRLPPARAPADPAAPSLPVLGGFAFALLRKRGFDGYEERILHATGATSTR